MIRWSKSVSLSNSGLWPVRNSAVGEIWAGLGKKTVFSGGFLRGVRPLGIRRKQTSSLTEQTKLDDDVYELIIQQGYQGLEKLQVPRDYSSENQNMTVASKENKLQQLVDEFNNDTVDVTIGYGSGVFEQDGYNGKSQPQVDMIHVVENTGKFHTKNVHRFNQHYSGLKYGGVKLIEFFQNLGLVSIYFNPYITMKQTTIKYGIISEALILKDLIEWRTLYLAGRLQKPVKFITNSSGDQDSASAKLLKFVNEFNLRNAVKICLLMSTSKVITEQTLYELITLISYLGDSRMIIGGENPNKIKNIVNKQFGNFQKLYAPILKQFEIDNLISRKDDVILIPHFSNDQKKSLIGNLPKHFRTQLLALYTHNQHTNDPVGGIVRESDPYIRELLIRALKKVVLAPSIFVSLKGLFTAGIYKSVRYMIDKRLKYLQQ